jgi:hypothetical protein
MGTLRDEMDKICSEYQPHLFLSVPVLLEYLLLIMHKILFVRQQLKALYSENL